MKNVSSFWSRKVHYSPVPAWLWKRGIRAESISSKNNASLSTAEKWLKLLNKKWNYLDPYRGSRKLEPLRLF